MATYTGNLNLKKPSLDDDALITDINNNMDILDTAANGIQDALAIVANGDTHVAITAGQYVYVRKHNTLAEGLYVASSNIAANAALSSSNLTADSKGGMNAISEKIGTVPSGQTVEGQISSISEQIANLSKSIVDTEVDLSAYTSGQYYTTSSDGYLRSYAPADAYVIYRIYGSSGTKFVYDETANTARHVIYVKKGMRIEVRAKSGSIELTFNPLV